MWKEYIKLSDCKEGDTVKLSAVIQTSSDFLKFLNSRNLRLGMKLKIRRIESFDKSVQISYGQQNKETLSNTVCERLLVEK